MVNNLAASGPLGLSAFGNASSTIELRPDWMNSNSISDTWSCWVAEYIMKSGGSHLWSLLRQGSIAQQGSGAVAKSDLSYKTFLYQIQSTLC